MSGGTPGHESGPPVADLTAKNLSVGSIKSNDGGKVPFSNISSLYRQK